MLILKALLRPKAALFISTGSPKYFNVVPVIFSLTDLSYHPTLFTPYLLVLAFKLAGIEIGDWRVGGDIFITQQNKLWKYILHVLKLFGGRHLISDIIC